MDPPRIDNDNNHSQISESSSAPSIQQNIENSEPIKKKNWKKIIGITAAILVAIPLIGYLILVISFSGGIGGVISSLKPAPNPQTSSVSKKREAAKSNIDNTFMTVDSSTGFTNHAVSVHDSCYEGQNNWKVHDGYAHRCTYRITKFYGFNGDFRQQMIDFEQKIMNIGWKPIETSRYPMKEIMERYYDKYYGRVLPVQGNAWQEKYLVSSLPTPIGGYQKDKGLLDIEYAEKETTDLLQIEYAQNVAGGTFYATYDKQDFQDVNSVFKKITKDNKYVLLVSIQEDYFQN